MATRYEIPDDDMISCHSNEDYENGGILPSNEGEKHMTVNGARVTDA